MYVSDSSGDNGHNLNPKGVAVIDPDLKANTNGNALSAVESVTYLGVTFSNNAKWTTHVEEILRKCVRLSFFVKRLRKVINAS